MGSLAGHVLPGCLFLIYGMSWALLSFWTHFQLRSSAEKRAKTKRPEGTGSFLEYKRDHGLSRKSWIPLSCCQRIPVEPAIKILLPLIGVFVEEFLAFEPVSKGSSQQHLVTFVYKPIKDGHFTGLGKLQHIIMYSGFCISGVVDIVSVCVRLPRHTSQIFLFFAFLIEALLFYFHAEGHDPLNVQVHWIITVTIFICAAFAALRMLQATNLFINSGLAYSIFLQGIWFIHAGYLLYPPNRNQPWLKSSELHDGMMFVAACLTIHILWIAAFFLCLWVAMRLIVTRCCSSQSGVNRKVLRLRGPPNWADPEENERLIDAPNKGSPSTGEGGREDGAVVVEMKTLDETAA